MDTVTDTATVPGGAPPEPGGGADGAGERSHYSITQAAAHLGVSRVTIWRWIGAGRLPVARLGHRTARIKREDLERLLVVPRGPAAPRSAGAGVRGRRVDENGRRPRRPRPAAAWAAPAAPGAAAHVVQFYEADGILLDTVGEFVGEALRAGDAAVVIATEAHRAGLEDRLGAAGLDVAAVRAEGRYVALDAAETLARLTAGGTGGAPDPARFAAVVGGLLAGAAAGGRRVRVFGEMVALLLEAGDAAAALRLEAMWNELQETHAFSLMCGYPLDGFGAGAADGLLGEVCAAHTRVVPAEGYTALADPDDRLRAVAELQRKARALEAEIALRERAEEQLRATLASERRKERELRDFVETAPLGLHWVGPDGAVLWVNRAEAALLGYRPEELVGHHIAELHADRAVIDDLLARLRRGETLREYPARLRCKDGAIKHVLIDSSGLWEAGRFVHSRCFTRDVTALRQAEAAGAGLLQRERAARREAQRAAEQTHRLQEIAGQLSRSLEADRVLESIARAAADLLRVPVGAVFLLDGGAPGGDFVLAAAHGIDPGRTPDLRLPRRASLAGRALDAGRTLVVDDARGTPGTAMPALLTGEAAGAVIAAPITAAGAGLGVVQAFSRRARRFSPEDAALLTALAAAAAVALTNARLYREAQDAIRARDEFLASAAHDLKTPLTVVRGMAQLLRRRTVRPAAPDAAGLAEGLQGIDAAATKMGQQLDELLDATRLEAGQRLELRRLPTDAVALARRVAAEQQATTERHRVRVESALPELTGAWDAVRLGRVLDNLLANAIKYSPAGGDVVVTVAREDGAAGAWAVLAVTDHGLGVPAADLPRIFERFRRAGNVAGRIGGTGIGLASARQLVEQHGGALTAESVEGLGSTFTVRLPLAPGAARAPGGEPARATD